MGIKWERRETRNEDWGKGGRKQSGVKDKKNKKRRKL